MDSGLLARRLPRRPGRRVRPNGRRLLRARTSRGVLVHFSIVRAGELPKSLRFGLPHQQRRHSIGQRPWLMTRWIHGSGTETSMPTATLLVLACFFVSTAAWPLEATSPAATKAAAAT